MYAQVIIDIAHAKVDHVFSYQVPEDMENRRETAYWCLLERAIRRGRSTSLTY